MKYFRHLPNMFDIVIGPWSIDKIYLDDLIALLLVHFDFIVKICNASNSSANAVVLALHKQIEQS